MNSKLKAYWTTMRFWRWHKRGRIWRRRLVAVVALSAYLVTIVGMPLPASVSKRHGAPFPCQHHNCGCSTADECWDHCCCYTASQKLAWAREHHVEPPGVLVAEVARHERPIDDESLTAPPSRACCAKPKEHSCDAHPSCDESGGSCHEHDATSRGVTFVAWIMARQCRGLAVLWCASGAALPPPPIVDWQFQWDVVEWLAMAAHPLWSGEFPPPVPPPRI